MKAAELMIGDWVNIPQANVGLRKIDVGDISFFTEFEPIPLTPEILEKNGFICDGEDEEGNTSYSLSLKKGAYEARYYVWGYLTKQGFDIVFGANNQPCELYLCYVHELQHALRLCGLDELANNFKV